MAGSRLATPSLRSRRESSAASRFRMFRIVNRACDVRADTRHRASRRKLNAALLIMPRRVASDVATISHYYAVIGLGARGWLPAVFASARGSPPVPWKLTPVPPSARSISSAWIRLTRMKTALTRCPTIYFSIMIDATSLSLIIYWEKRNITLRLCLLSSIRSIRI